MPHPPAHQARGERGVVAAKHRLAAEAGVWAMEQGGNAVDAAVATAFASGVVEPWMSGIGGGGFTVVRLPDGSTHVVDAGVRAPLAARSTMYETMEGRATGLFPWPPVRDDANHQGWRAVAVPGQVAGLALLVERFGRLSLARLLQPPIRLAADGFPVSWFTTLRVAMDSAIIARYPETARTFLPNGFPVRPPAGGELPPTLLKQPALADTLERIAHGGPDVFYRGEVAEKLVAASQEAGGLLAAEDLARYEAAVEPALVKRYRGWQVATTPGLTGGPTVLQALRLLDLAGCPRHTYGSVEYVDLAARALRAAFADRYARIGAAGQWEDLLDEARLQAQAAELRPAAVRAGEPAGTSTTQIATADADGTFVSCTQTLVSAFGSRVTAESTGVLLNNGMFWFDPLPGKPNSVGPGKRPLSNMAPLVATSPNTRTVVALGSSGGRRIMCANVHMLLGLVDGNLDLADAVAQARFDVSDTPFLADRRLDPALLDGLRMRGHEVVELEESIYPQNFASAAAAMRLPAGTLVGAADPLMPAHVAAC